MNAADPAACACCFRLPAQAIGRLAARLALAEPEPCRLRVLLWLRVLAEDLLAERGDAEWAVFDLTAAIDETVRRCVREAARPNLVVALVADDPLPRRVLGDAGRLARLLEGLLAGAVQTAERSEVLIEVTVAREDEEWAEIRFLAGEDFTRLGARSPACLAAADPAESRAPASLTALGSDEADPSALWFSLRFRKAPPKSLAAERASGGAVTAAASDGAPLDD